jgi:phage shock protein E
MRTLLASLLFVVSSLAVAAEPYLIDVRTTMEWNMGHIEQAVHIPHGDIAERISEVTADKDATIYLYCRSGNRAGKAKQALESMGYVNVQNLGGMDDAEQFLQQQVDAQ